VTFGVLQLMFIGHSFVQMPKNVKKFMKSTSIKEGYKKLLWEEKNFMENTLNEFFDDFGNGIKYEYNIQDDYQI